MPLDLKRHEGESEIEFQYRISSMKDLIGTWDEVADIINNALGYDYGESKYRKDYTAFTKMLEVHAKECSNTKEEIAALEEAAANLRNERYKLNTTKAELNRNERYNARAELFYENLKDAFDRLDPPVFNQVQASNDCCECVLKIADIHYGATFTSENNTYSREICKRRLDYLLAEMKKMAKSGVRDLKVLNLGDSIQGILRLSDVRLNDIPVVEAVVEVSRLLANFLNELSKDYRITYYHCTSSNHSQTRPLGSKANELSGEDLEKIIASNIETALSGNDRVKVLYNFNSDYIYFDLFNKFNCVAAHGHRVRQRGSALMDGLSNLHNIHYDYVFIGHDHSGKEEVAYEGDTYNKEVFTCPGFIGSDPYSDSLLCGSRPGAKLFTFDKMRGHIMSYNIIFNDEEE